MLNTTQLVREMAAFIATAPDSGKKTRLLNTVAEYHKARRKKRQPVTPDHSINRTPGVIAAAKYLLFKGVEVPLEQITTAIHEHQQH